MKEAIKSALEAGKNGEIPVGAVIVKNGEIIATGRNRREEKHSVLGHAELDAMENAAKKLNDWRLNDCELYVTLEPCPMCAGAIINSRIKKVVFGAFDKKMGAVDSVTNLFSYDFGSHPEVFAGIAEDECSALLKNFFGDVRNTDTIRYCHEPTPLQCGQAVLAMLTGKPVENVVREVGTENETTLGDMVRFCESNGISFDKTRREAIKKEELPRLCILSLETPRCWHWSLFADGVFYDPEHGVTDDFPEAKRKYYFTVTKAVGH